MNIGKHKVPSDGVFIIAEMSSNHLQSYDLACKTIEAMAKSGANAVKLQTYTPDSMTLDHNSSDFLANPKGPWAGQSLYSLYEKSYTPKKWHKNLKNLANDLSLEFFSSPFDAASADFLEELDVPAYKIASFEITDIPLIRHVAKKKKPIIISTGIATYADIELAVNTCRSVGNHDIVILQCVSSYPAPIHEANLVMMNQFENDFNIISGLSDHTLGIAVPVAAAVLGAKVIEKHFTIDRAIGGSDATFSLNAKEFTEMVKSVRQAEKAIGRRDYQLSENQQRSKRYCRSLYVVKDITKGDVFTENNIRSIRPGFGMHPQYLESILGKKSKEKLKTGTPLEEKHIGL